MNPDTLSIISQSAYISLCFQWFLIKGKKILKSKKTQIDKKYYKLSVFVGSFLILCLVFLCETFKAN